MPIKPCGEVLYAGTFIIISRKPGALAMKSLKVMMMNAAAVNDDEELTRSTFIAMPIMIF